MTPKDKISYIKKIRQELKKDYGICGAHAFEWGCFSCHAYLVDKFLAGWLRDIADELKDKKI